MQCVHEATHITEAHMFLHLLENEGFEARVDGEYLQGAMGELPVSGLVRVMVSDEDYQQASAFLTEWHSKQAKVDEVYPPQKKEVSSFNWAYAVMSFSIGAIVASLMVAHSYSIPVSTEGFDYNGDGVLDEKYTYKGNRIEKTEIDSNLDGKKDYMQSYDSEGWLTYSLADLDFDGNFETEGEYKNNMTELKEIDTDRNGKIDLRFRYKFGNLEEKEFLDSEGKRVLKREKYSPFKLETAEFDSDGDGILDTLYEYDAFEQIKSQSKIDGPSNPE